MKDKLSFWKMEDDLNLKQMEDDLNLKQMENDLNIFANGRLCLSKPNRGFLGLGTAQTMVFVVAFANILYSTAIACTAKI